MGVLSKVTRCSLRDRSLLERDVSLSMIGFKDEGNAGNTGNTGSGVWGCVLGS